MSDQRPSTGDAGRTQDHDGLQPGQASATPSEPASTVPDPQPPEWPTAAPQGLYATVPPGGYVQAQSGYYVQGATPGYVQLQARPQASSNAIVALVLSIVSWLAIPVIPAIVALVLASKASKEIAASNGWLTGSGMALTAKILSWINIGFYVLFVVFMAFIIIALIAAGSFEPSTVPTSDFGT